MACKNCKWYMDCAIFASAIEDSGGVLTDEIAEEICQCVRKFDYKQK